MPEFVAYRLAAWDTPLWVNPNRSEGRFNRPLDGPTQYLSLHPLTPWAEYLRREDRRTPEDLREFRIRVWAVRAILAEVTEISFDEAPAWGLDAAGLVADDYARCQDLARRIREDPGGSKAIIVPSAGLPGTRNLVLFGPRVAVPYLAAPIDEVDVPVGHVAEDATALAGLLDRVRFRGEPHAEYEAWRRGREYRFIDPPARPHL
ncbi:MAG: RES family NAD+ phosphorylase [Acidobacteria bacterium]|nr:RES family NAD+ phosphorylase [Acidobacteriota bacterium]